MGRAPGFPPAPSDGAAGWGALGPPVASAGEPTLDRAPRASRLLVPAFLVYGLFMVGVLSGQPLLIILSLLGALALVVLLGFALRTPARRKGLADQLLVVHTGGLVHSIGGRTQDALLWDDVTEIRILSGGGLGSFVQTCHLTLGNGQRTVLSSQRIGGLFSVLDRIEEGVARAQLPAALASIEAGTPVRFGALSLGADGLASGADRLPWAEVRITGHPTDGVIRIDRSAGGTWRRQQAAQFPNLALFRLLAERHTPRP
ncbi:DUF6585 family protein [Kitasatospora sp. NBC_01539]|uniref:DUF6585 family protein n=1 Tax=Kitasatospora sp. NBC_01539 TaxID=2903577 RepID=UPI00386026D2